MILYTSFRAPNPRRVHVYLAEKELHVPTRTLDLGAGEQFSAAYSALNPDHVVPTLVLDDGTVITESIAICRYFEALHPHPPLFGRDAREQAIVEMWLRRLELQGYLAVQDIYRNGRDRFVGRALPGARDGVPQIPDLVHRAEGTLKKTMAKIDDRLRLSPFIAGDGLTVADIVAFTTLEFAHKIRISELIDLASRPAVAAWYERMQARPSTREPT